MPELFYRVLHIAGVIFLYFSLGALAYQWAEKLTKKKSLNIIHGIALAVIFISGFGLLAKLKISGAGAFALTKMFIWLILGLSPLLFRRLGFGLMSALVLSGVLGVLAIIFANYRILIFGL